MAVHDQPHHQSRRQAVGHRTFNSAQMVAGIIGLALLIVGGVAMVRAGFSSLTAETTTILGIGHTLLMGIIDVIVGILFLGAASRVFGSSGQMIGLGILTIAFGAVVLIEPSPFVEALGDGRSIGAIYLIIGLVSLVAGLSSRTVVTESVVTDEVDDHHLH